MADLSVTASAVQPGSNATIERRYAFGATVVAGQTVYLDPTTKQWLLADSNGAAAASHQTQGIAVNGGAVGQPAAVQTGGDLTMNAVLTAGVAYYQSATPGGIAPVADLGSGMYPCLLGMAKTTTVLAINIQFPGVSL